MEDIETGDLRVYLELEDLENMKLFSLENKGSSSVPQFQLLLLGGWCPEILQHSTLLPLDIAASPPSSQHIANKWDGICEIALAAAGSSSPECPIREQIYAGDSGFDTYHYHDIVKIELFCVMATSLVRKQLCPE